MPIDFDEKRWGKIKTDSEKWWAGELERPLIQVRLKGRTPGRQKPFTPLHRFACFYEMDVPAEKIVDRWDYELCCTKFMGDAFPYVRSDFGPVPVAAFLGAKLQNGNETVWYSPEKVLPITELKFEYSADNVWLNRAKSLLQTSVKHWGSLVQMSLDVGAGNLDVASMFRPAENMVYDLYDYPEHVKRIGWEVYDAWWKIFNELESIIQPACPGYAGWAKIFSNHPYNILQSDFSYMISAEMFDEFIKPELQATAKKLTNAFYHLDGPGSLTHLDALLEIEEIKGIQWIPGDGQPDISKWPDVYRKIHDAGKLIQFFNTQYDGGFEIMDIISDQLGSAKGIVYIVDTDISQQDKAQAMLEKYNAT